MKSNQKLLIANQVYQIVNILNNLKKNNEPIPFLGFVLISQLLRDLERLSLKEQYQLLDSRLEQATIDDGSDYVVKVGAL